MDACSVTLRGCDNSQLVHLVKHTGYGLFVIAQLAGQIHLRKDGLPHLQGRGKTFDGILCFFQYSRFNKSVQNLHAVNAVLASCLKLVQPKEKSVAHTLSSLRHIILPIVCDMVKHVLQPVKLSAVQYADSGNGDIL